MLRRVIFSALLLLSFLKFEEGFSQEAYNSELGEEIRLRNFPVIYDDKSKGVNINDRLKVRKIYTEGVGKRELLSKKSLTMPLVDQDFWVPVHLRGGDLWLDGNGIKSNGGVWMNTNSGGTAYDYGGYYFGIYDYYPMAINKDGNVLVGKDMHNYTITTPANLHVHNTNINSHLLLSGRGPGLRFSSTISGTDEGTLGLATVASDYISTSSAGDIVLFKKGTGNILFATNNNNGERMRITNAGNIGIGIAPTIARLEVEGRADGTNNTTTALFRGSGSGISIISNSTWGSGGPEIAFNSYSSGSTKKSINSGYTSSFIFNPSSGRLDYNTTDAAAGVYGSAVQLETSKFSISRTGLVGIGLGASDAAEKLHVKGGNIKVESTTYPNLQLYNGTNTWAMQYSSSTSGATDMLFRFNGGTKVKIEGNSGNVGIGVDAVNDRLTVGGGMLRILGTDAPSASSAAGILKLGSNTTTSGTNSYSAYSWIQSGTNTLLLLNPVDGSGAVAINHNPATASYPFPSGYALYVKGNILCEELKVQLRSSWSDYVFDKDYKLRSLDSVEAFINENKHLPEVPSAKEIEKDGINTGEMDALLLKKIEELTLYMIEQKKEIEALKQKNIELESKIK